MQHHFAQFNIARLLHPVDDPAIKDFVDNLDEINGQADRAPGFVWRHQDESGNSTHADPYGDPLVIINFSVWLTAQHLIDWSFSGDHLAIMRRRREWFEKHTEPYHACWWIPAGHVPTVEEAMARLRHLQEHGSSDHAFGMREKIAPPA